MARNEISTLKISIDIDRATKKIIAFRQEVGNTKREVQQGGQALNQYAASADRAGQSSTTAAVNFQTMSQGMLNLSTSMVQTATSFSNLDRAQNRAKMAAIAVARAEDLLAAKKLRLDDLTKAGLGNTQKAINLNKELATATADLVVKQEKQVIEQGAVNDVYMLFFANIANVGFSTMQTLVALLGQEKAARIGATMATKLHTFSTWENLRAHRMNQKMMAMNSKVLDLTTIGQTKSILATKLSTIATKAQSVALHGLKIALGPIGLGFMAIAAAMDLMMGKNSMILNFLYDITGGMIGLSSEIEKVTEAEQELDTVTGELSDTLGFKMPHSLADAVIQLEKYRKEVKDTAVAQREMNEEMQETQEIQKKTTNLQPSGSGSWQLLPQAFADTGEFKDQPQGQFATSLENKRGNIQSSETSTTAYANQDQKDFAESVVNQRDLAAKIKSEGVSAMTGFVGGTAGPTKFDPTRELGKLAKDPNSSIYGFSVEDIAALSTDEINQILKQEYIIPYLEKFTTDKDFFLEQYQRQQTMKSLQVFKPEEYRVHQLSEQAKLKQKEWLGQTQLTSLQKQRMKIGTGVNIEGRIHDGMALGVDTASKLKQIAYPDLPEYEVDDKPNEVLKKMVGTISGTLDQDDPLYELLKMGKSGLTESRLAIAAKYGIDVGTGGQEIEAQFAVIQQQLADKRKGIISDFLVGGGTYLDQATYQSRNISGTTSFQQGRKSLGQMSQFEALMVNRATQSTQNTAIAAAQSYYQNVVYGEATGSMARSHAAAQALGRATWYKERAKDSAFQTGNENIRYWVERTAGTQLSAEDVAAINSLQSSHNEQVQLEAEKAFDTGKKVNLVWLRIQAQNNAKALGQSISNRIATEKATALQFGNQLGISQNEALQILRDKSQGEQTLNDMLAYQQRLDAMSSGVV